MLHKPEDVLFQEYLKYRNRIVYKNNKITDQSQKLHNKKPQKPSHFFNGKRNIFSSFT